MPASIASSRARSIEVMAPGTLREIEKTAGCLLSGYVNTSSTAHSKPATKSPTVPSPEQETHCTGTMVTSLATPESIPAVVPAVWVPWKEADDPPLESVALRHAVSSPAIMPADVQTSPTKRPASPGGIEEKPSTTRLPNS